MGLFKQRKESILSKEDKSSIGKWDEMILNLCEKINVLDEYYTTSSCSGRIIVMKDLNKKGPGLFEFVSHEKINFESFLEEIRKLNLNNLKFKQESVILHVACIDLESAKDLLDKGQRSGFKRSGIISLGENIIVELNSTERLEFPLVESMDEAFLKKVIEKANNNLEKGWKKLGRLGDLF